MFLFLAFAYFFSASQPIDLSNHEKSFFSQNGEDGVIEKIFSVIGAETKYYVEFGVENGTESNTRALREFFGWDGLLMDSRYADESINLKQEFITAENINDLFRKYEIPQEFDLLSIDIDYNDFYVWQAIEEYAPRVVVIEYNASHHPDQDKIVLYHPKSRWDGTNYFGASIASFAKLGAEKGYTLVYAEKKGVNLFFIRDDILQKHNFLNAGSVHKLYRKPCYGYGPNDGHPNDPLNRPYLTFADTQKR